MNLSRPSPQQPHLGLLSGPDRNSQTVTHSDCIVSCILRFLLISSFFFLSSSSSTHTLPTFRPARKLPLTTHGLLSLAPFWSTNYPSLSPLRRINRPHLFDGYFVAFGQSLPIHIHCPPLTRSDLELSSLSLPIRSSLLEPFEYIAEWAGERIAGKKKRKCKNSKNIKPLLFQNFPPRSMTTGGCPT